VPSGGVSNFTRKGLARVLNFAPRGATVGLHPDVRRISFYFYNHRSEDLK